MSRSVAFVLKGYPRLSETFIANEIRALEARGLDIRIVSLRRPTDHARHPVHDEIAAPVLYLPEYLYQKPLRVVRGLLSSRKRPGFAAATRTWLRDLARDPTPNRIRRFGQAVVLAAELPGGVDALHAHFLHTPASVTRYAALMAGLPWTVSAHAKDIWTTPNWEKAEKIAACDWLVTCSAAGHDHLSELAAAPEKISLVYHGLDAARFPPPDAPRPARDGSDPADPVVILCVARAVEKKGIDTLVRALAALPRDLHWRLIHIGGGPDRRRLGKQAERLGIAGRISWRGALAQAEVIEAYRAADLFALPARVAGSGDRDGLPNVLMEAQSQGLACVSTRIAAIPELIEHGRNGLLVAPDDPNALGAALAALIRDPDLRAGLGRAGAERVRRDFAFDAGIDRLARLFGLAMPASAAGAEGASACGSLSTRR